MTEKQEKVEVDPKPVTDIVYQPDAVMKTAISAAATLKEIVKKAGMVVTVAKKDYLQFEGWQTCGRFYGVTAKAIEAELVEIGGVQGFKAKAVALKDGVEISGAIAYCMYDEPNWKGKPLFQLASMSQTRAMAKALRSVLSWVVTLSGFAATPAEEMTDTAPFNNGNDKLSERHYDFISEKQAKRFYALCNGNKKADPDVKKYLQEIHGIDSAMKLKPEAYEMACDWAQGK